MKKILLVCLLVSCLIASGVCHAAQWPKGFGPEQPYSNVKPVDLKKSMGYIILMPRAKMHAKTFSDTMQMFLPREDIELAEGTLRLMEVVEGEKDPVEVCAVDFSDRENVSVRPMIESELVALMWGGGVCIEARLPRSLEFGDHQYYVTMDEGCFTAANGKIKSVQVVNPEAWQPAVDGDYGISGLFYSDAPVAAEVEDDTAEVLAEEYLADEEEAPEDEDESFEDGDGNMFGFGDSFEVEDGAVAGAEDGPEEEPEEEPEPKAASKQADEAPEAEAVPAVPKSDPKAGDIVTFDLIMGGDAKVAIIFSENGSVDFDEIEYTKSCKITGKVIKDDINWGIVFQNDANEAVEVVYLKR